MKWLEEIHENDLPEVGKKALELARLRRAGFPVPNAFVITCSTCREMFSRRLGSHNRMNFKKLIKGNASQYPITERVLSGFKTLGSHVAVRSSAVKEDLKGASFAGLFETLLNINGEEALFQAIKTCIASQFSGRVREYARRNKISYEDLKLAVLIQKQLKPETSGVLFTVNPVTGNDREIVIEAVQGLGESLVSGRVQPERYLINGFSERVTERVLSSEQAVLSTGPGGGAFIKSKPQTGACLDDTILGDLGCMAVKIQVLYGFPQDIEWAIADRRIHILQSRPITAISYQRIDGEWTTADFRDGGVSSQVVTSFMWSLYQHVYDSAMHSYLERIRLIRRNRKIQWSKVIFGRPYWNVGAVKKALIRMPGFTERNFDKDLGIEITYQGDGAVTPFRLLGLLRAIPVMLAIGKTYLLQRFKTQKAVRKFEHYEKVILTKNLSAMKSEDLGELFADLVHNRHFELETAYFKTIFNTANARLDFKAMLDKANKKGAGFEYLPMITSLKPLKTAAPLFELWNISRRINREPEAIKALTTGKTEKIFAHPILGAALKDFIKKYGYHSTRELDLRTPRWCEDPKFVIETLQAYSKLDDKDNPRTRVEMNKNLYENELKKLRRFFSGHKIFQRKRFMRKLERVRFHTWYKEEVRDRSTRMYRLIRNVSLEVGHRLTQNGILSKNDHIFYLPYQEVIAIIRDKTPDPETIRRRIQANKIYMLSFRNFDNPNEIGHRWRYHHDDEIKKSETDRIYRGIACASGKTTGVIRVIRDINESNKLQNDDILVTRFTDPGWTTLFPLLSGVITETGGILSHAAVIAREYGVPAVLAVPNATQNLEDGQRVILDGNKGEVRIL